MNIKRAEIKLSNIQIKSLECAKILAKSLNIIQERCGIHEVKITLEEPFICSWIDLGRLNKTPMEKLLRDILIKLDTNR